MSGAPADLSQYATHFDELQTEEKEVIFDLNAINPLSELREVWQNTSNTASEHHLSITADSNQKAFLETEAHGEYSAGFMAQAGIGARVPAQPTGDGVLRWGYYEVDANDDPLNGFYFGADSTGVFVARADGGDVEKVYQDSWNRDKLGEGALNPSDRTFDTGDGHVFQIDFTYYGYGPIEMNILLDDDDDDQFGSADLVTCHVFNVSGDTTTKNTNVPVRADIDTVDASHDALDLFIGGRQFAVIGSRSPQSRTTWHYLDELAAVDDTKWHHAISFKLKDGTDIGSTDFTHILGEIRRFYADTDTNPYKWQIRRETTPDNPTWENPESAEDKQDETAFKVDTASADVQDGSGNLTGVNLDGGMLTEGSNNEADLSQEELDGEIVGDQVVSLLFKAKPTTSGTVSEILWKVGEGW